MGDIASSSKVESGGERYLTSTSDLHTSAHTQHIRNVHTYIGTSEASTQGGKEKKNSNNERFFICKHIPGYSTLKSSLKSIVFIPLICVFELLNVPYILPE